MWRAMLCVPVLLALTGCVISDVAPEEDPYSHQFRLSGGWFAPFDNTALLDESDGFALEMGGTWFTSPAGPLALDAQIFFAANRYDTTVPTPPFGSVDDRTDLTRSGLEVGPRLVLGRHQDLRAFVRAGVGIHASRMSVDANASGLDGEYEDDDFAPGTYAGFGFEGRVKRLWLGIEWRWTFLEGDFGAPFNARNVDLGGGVVALSVAFAL